MSPKLRVIGDVHAQIEHADLFTRDAPTYLEIIAGAAYSIQLGDMGDPFVCIGELSYVDIDPAGNVHGRSFIG